MNVKFLPAAEQDLGDIFLYITDNLKNPIAARNITTKILQRTQALENFPEIGVELSIIDPRFSNYHYLVVDNYLVIYNVADAEVRIVRILYARSDYMQLLRG